MVFIKYATTMPCETRLPKRAYDALKAISEIKGGPGKFVKITTKNKVFFGSLESVIGSNTKGEVPLNFLNNSFENKYCAKYHFLKLQVPHDYVEYRIIDICDIKELKIFVPHSQNSENGVYKTFLEKHGNEDSFK